MTSPCRRSASPSTARRSPSAAGPRRAGPCAPPQVTVSGVTVAGGPAQIDDKGVHVAGHDGPSLTQQVAQQGIDIHTVGSQRNDTSSLARSQATGLIVT